MTAATFDLKDDAIIEQGSYWSLTIRYPGNLAGASLKGQIRRDYNGQALQSFRFTPFTYDEDEDKSTALMFLNAGQTQLLPMPATNSGFWRYDVKLYRPGQDPIRLIQGKVFVSPGITDIGE